MQLFYTPHVVDKSYTLNENESKHCAKVLRYKVGDEIHLIDGIGHFYKAILTDVHPKKCRFQITHQQAGYQLVNETLLYPKPSYQLHIAIAPPKNASRLEWFLEKSTEIGIDIITPIVTHYSERKQIRLERLQKILVASMKQTLKTQLPQLNPLTSLHDFLAQVAQQNTAQKYIPTLLGNTKPLKSVYTKGSDAILMIGPEGGFTIKEVEQAQQSGFAPVSLGNSRLRTETAAIVGCHSIHFANI